MEKSSLTLLHRLVFNLKRLIEKVPLGKTQFASYVVALALLKEHCELSDEQGEELYEKFYRWLKDNDKFDPEQLTEAVDFKTIYPQEHIIYVIELMNVNQGQQSK